MRAAPGSGQHVPGLPRRVIAAVAVGTPLTPLNSTMIAVALVQIQEAFSVSVASTTWLVSSFYIAASIGQPLMGRVVDQFGPRRMYCVGLGLVALTGVLTPLSTSLGWLIAFRVLLAVGTSAAYPAGMAIYRREGGNGGQMPVVALSVTSVAASATAALGPVIGGFVISLAGWPAIFLVNLPFAVVGVVLALAWIPADAPPAVRRSGRDVVALLDVPGVVAFAIAMTSSLGLLLSLPERPMWWLLPVGLVAWALFLWREVVIGRGGNPFLDLAMLRSNGALVGVLGQFLAVNVVFYVIYFGLPIWLERVRELAPAEVGLLVLPSAAVSMIGAPLAARAVTRYGAGPVIMAGSLLMVISCGGMFLLDLRSPPALILLISLAFGVPNSLNNLGLQLALYEAAPLEHTGAAAGLYQSSRYIGAVLASTVLGLVTGASMSTTDLHRCAVVALAVSLGLVVVSYRARAGRGPRTAT